MTDDMNIIQQYTNNVNENPPLYMVKGPDTSSCGIDKDLIMVYNIPNRC